VDSVLVVSKMVIATVNLIAVLRSCRTIDSIRLNTAGVGYAATGSGSAFSYGCRANVNGARGRAIEMIGTTSSLIFNEPIPHSKTQQYLPADPHSGSEKIRKQPGNSLRIVLLFFFFLNVPPDPARKYLSRLRMAPCSPA
jgi:hypothetical protein